MKIPSLARVPKYRRFNFEPRHYDPIKEDLKNRTEHIEQQLKNNSSETAVKQRISETFVRDKHRTGGKVNGLQIVLVFLLSATFVGFLYIGFYAFFITGVIILLYVLYQLGTFKGITTLLNRKYEPEDEAITAASKIAAGQMREGQYFYRDRSVNKKGSYKLLLLLASMTVAAGYYWFALNGIMCLLLIFILLIMFVKESSKAK